MKASVLGRIVAYCAAEHLPRLGRERDCTMADSREPRLMAPPGEKSSEDRVVVMLTRDRRDGVG